MLWLLSFAIVSGSLYLQPPQVMHPPARDCACQCAQHRIAAVCDCERDVGVVGAIDVGNQTAQHNGAVGSVSRWRLIDVSGAGCGQLDAGVVEGFSHGVRIARLQGQGLRLQPVC
jgi:hypothetical protein